MEGKPTIIRYHRRYFQYHETRDLYVEGDFLWFNGSSLHPYWLYDGVLGGHADFKGAFLLFKEAFQAGQALGSTSFQIVDIRNPNRFFTQGKGWSDGRP